MSAYITYMEVNYDSEGVSPKKLLETLTQLGWSPIYGRYDYIFRWRVNWAENESNIHEYFDRLNNTHEVLKKCHVNYSLRTYEFGREDFWVKCCD
jgi:hypothetical protein